MNIQGHQIGMFASSPVANAPRFSPRPRFGLTVERNVELQVHQEVGVRVGCDNVTSSDSAYSITRPEIYRIF